MYIFRRNKKNVIYRRYKYGYGLYCNAIIKYKFLNYEKT